MHHVIYPPLPTSNSVCVCVCVCVPLRGHKMGEMICIYWQHSAAHFFLQEKEKKLIFLPQKSVEEFEDSAVWLLSRPHGLIQHELYYCFTLVILRVLLEVGVRC